jgi:hypothetical protein
MFSSKGFIKIFETILPILTNDATTFDQTTLLEKPYGLPVVLILVGVMFPRKFVVLVRRHGRRLP